MKEAAKVYQKDHPDVTVDVIETPWEDIQTKLTTAATSNAHSPACMEIKGLPVFSKTFLPFSMYWSKVISVKSSMVNPASSKMSVR